MKRLDIGRQNGRQSSRYALVGQESPKVIIPSTGSKHNGLLPG
jgi:hypothetical protein